MSPRTDLKMIFLATCVAAMAQSQGAAPTYETVNLAVEAPAALVSLPSSPEAPLVMASCFRCPVKSFPTTLSTAYFIGDEQVSLAELRSAVAADPTAFLTVAYSVETGELIAVSAEIVRPAAASRR